jgi:hypothetical protein
MEGDEPVTTAELRDAAVAEAKRALRAIEARDGMTRDALERVTGPDGCPALRVLHEITLTGRPGSLDEARAISARALALFEGRLERNAWLAATRPTVADVACCP